MLAIAMLLLGLSFLMTGCPALMIPGLGYSAYQAYKYGQHPPSKKESVQTRSNG